MDKYLFETQLKQCTFVEEHTGWIEILNYSVSNKSKVFSWRSVSGLDVVEMG